MMTLVQLIPQPQAPLLAAPYYANGDPGPIVTSLAQVPELLEVAMPFVAMALGPSAISLRIKEIIILRTSTVAQCRYCVDAHTVAAVDAGLDLDIVSALRDPLLDAASIECESDRELVRWIDAVAGESGPIDPHLASDLARHWSDSEIVELTMTISATLMLNRYCTALGLPTAPATLTRLVAAGFAP